MSSSKRAYGDDLPGEGQEGPCTITHGYRKNKRPDLKPFVRSMRCVDRAVPSWGKPEDGHTSEQPLKTTLWSEIAYILAHQGVGPGGRNGPYSLQEVVMKA